MEMPIKAFWSFNQNANRLQAEAELRLFQVIASSQSKSGSDYLEELKAEYGKPVVAVDKRRDNDANRKLRELLS